MVFYFMNALSQVNLILQKNKCIMLFLKVNISRHTYKYNWVHAIAIHSSSHDFYESQIKTYSY